MLLCLFIFHWGKNFIVQLLISVRHSTLCGELASEKKCFSMVNAIKLSIICMIILNLVFCIMISNQTVFLVWLVFRKMKTCPPFIFCVFKRFRRLFQKFSWVFTRNCEGKTWEANLHMFIEILVLLYADGTNIFRIKGGYAISTEYISVLLW